MPATKVKNGFPSNSGSSVYRGLLNKVIVAVFFVPQFAILLENTSLSKMFWLIIFPSLHIFSGQSMYVAFLSILPLAVELTGLGT